MTKKDSASRQEEEIIARTAPAGHVVYEAIYREGEEELERKTAALGWSGLAAGLSMGFSMISEALLQVHLPETRWRELISKLGYTIGFLIVILGRQQLFTKTTLTVILPLLKQPQASVFVNVARLWGAVLGANMIGAFAFACLIGHTDMFDPDVRSACLHLGREEMRHGFLTILLRGVFAGWLVALMIWLLPFAEAGRVWVIIIISYIVGLGHLAHIVAGGINVFYLLSTGQTSLWRSFADFLIPAFIGNVIGGVSLVAALAHAQFISGEGHGK